MKRLFATIVLAAAIVLGHQHASAQTVISQGQPEDVEITARELADRIVDYAATFLGTPYRYGANGPARFDCTGYTRYVYGHFGIDHLSRSSKGQATDGREVDITDFRNLQKGDILLLGSRRNPKVVGHVGIFIELDTLHNDPKFIHASNHGVRYSSICTESYYANRLLGARRVLPDFEDLDVEFDSTAAYAFDPSVGAHLAPDYLELSPSDRRVVLFSNGKWALVADDGTLVVPAEDHRIILDSNGNWAPIRATLVKVPASSLDDGPKNDVKDNPLPPAVKDTATARQVASSDTTAAAPAPAPQPEKVYYTIKSGDTLSKIAKQHHTTVAKLCQLNGITTTTILRVGRKLRVK